LEKGGFELVGSVVILVVPPKVVMPVGAAEHHDST
jgi:hypothetical protein